MEKTGISNTVIKRVTAFLTAAALAVLPIVVPKASAQTNVPIYDSETKLSYIIDVDRTTNKITAAIAGYKPDENDKGVIEIPEKITKAEYEVTGIAPSAFNDVNVKDLLTEVKLPKSLTYIGDDAFKECKNLKTIDLGSTSVTKIGSRAFLGCTAAEEAKLPETLTEIGYSAFYDCTKLNKITLPKKLTYIGQSAFSGCTSITEMTIPDTVTAIGSSAFNGCTSLEKVVLPKELKAIEDYTFYNCSKLIVITIPENVKSIGNSSFSSCTMLNAIEIPASVESIGSLAFSSCVRLSAVIIPYTLENISSNAFLNTNAEIWGYYNSYAYTYATKTAGLRFHAQGSVQNLTFSADNRDVTVNNIAITTSKGTLLIPPSAVVSGEQLAITVTAPSGFDIDYITINNENFSNGSTYTVSDKDVNIFVSYKSREAATTSAASSASSTGSDGAVIPTIPSDDETTQITDDGTNIDSYIKVNNDLEDINGAKVRIITQKTNFIGPAVIRMTNTAEATEAATRASEDLNLSDAIFYAFDISIFDQSGKENPGILAKGSVTLQVPVPNELLSYVDSIKVYHITDEDTEFIRSTVIEDISGVKRVQFETNSFSPYMLIAEVDEGSVNVIDEDDEDDSADTTQAAVTTNGGNEGGMITLGDDEDDISGNGGNDAQIVDDNTSSKPGKHTTDYDGNVNPHTGVMIAGVSIAGITLVCIPLVRSHNKKRKRTKSSVE